MRLVLLTCFLAVFLQKTIAQSPLAQPISENYQRLTLLEILQDFEKKLDIHFYYDPYKLPFYRRDFRFENKTVLQCLEKLLPSAGLSFAAVGENGIVICPKTELNRAYIDDLISKWNEGKIKLPEEFLPIEMSLNFGSATGKTSVMTARFSIKLFDEESREPIVGATIRVDSSKFGAVSDGLGQAEIELPRGRWTLQISAVGYRPIILKLALFESAEADIPLKIRPLGLQEIVIEGNAAANKTQNATTGLEMLPIALIKELPTFMGEADVVKSLFLLPGVTTVGDGATGFNVRGGNIDQNLVLLDEIPTLNTSHVLGFFSVFNTDLVRSTNLYKGHIPAQFGGRVSSVLDVKLRDGNFQKTVGGLGIGLATAKGWLETPLIKNRLALTAGFRTSYSDWMLKLIYAPQAKHSSARFYDGNLKLAYRFGAANSLIINTYRSSDYFRFTRDYGFGWKTQLVSASWKTVIGKKLVSSLTAQSGDYASRFFVPTGNKAFNISNGIRYETVKWNFTMAARGGHELAFGASGLRNRMRDEQFEPLDLNVLPAQTVPKDRGIEWAAWLNDEFKIREKWKISAGLRAVVYQNFGPKILYKYADGKPRVFQNVVDSVLIPKNKSVKTYSGLEPRLSLNYQISPENSLKISYNRLKQYLHLISNTAAATPADTWQVSNFYIPPQRADNFGAGLFHDFYQKKWEGSLEVFYKKTHDVPTYKNFAALLKNPHVETELLNGEMRSYGAEFFLKKNTGAWSGWLSYTFSRSWQRALAAFDDEKINGGAWFPADFDQPHQASLYLKWTANPENSASFNFSYRTGRPVSTPANNYQVGPVVVPNFLLRNNERIPDYFRLDVAFTVDKSKSKIKGVKTALTVSIYNLLSRENAFSVFFKPETTYGLLRGYQFSVIGSAIPALTLNFSWD